MPEIFSKSRVAVIDANGAHREKVLAALTPFYNTDAFDDCKKALLNLTHKPPDMIIINSQVSPWDPSGFIKEARGHEPLTTVPIVYIASSETDPETKHALEAGADGYIARPYPRSTLMNTITAKLNASIEKKWESLPAPQSDALQNSVHIFREISSVMSAGETVQFTAVKENCQPLVRAIETGNFIDILDGVRMHDDYTYAHSMRVATLLTLLGHAAGFKNDEQLLLSSGGLLHDVGKMKIPHAILNKPGRLNEEEFEVMKSHVPETVDYLKTCENIPKAIFIIAEQHHEKLDGTGYPHGLKASELNELARMAAVVDVFSALTDRRVYKDAMPAAKAMDIMVDEMAGNHLDSHFIKLFRGIMIDTNVLE